MKLLIIRFSSIGDIVLTTPVVRCIKQQIPGVELHYLTKLAYKPLLEVNPYIDKIHCFEDDLGSIIEILKTENFDEIIDLHHNLRTLRVKKALNKPAYSFNKLNWQKWLLVNFKINLMPDKSIVERYFQTVEHLDVANDGRGLDYFIPDNVRIENKDIPVSHWAGYIGCVIGGSYSTKKFPVEQWRRFCSESPFPVILLGGPEDKEEGNKIAAGNSVKVYNACGKFSLNESAWLIKHANLVISNDTGMMHIAAAFKKTIISLWGNTSPAMGMFPYYGNNSAYDHPDLRSFIIDKKKLYCHPCSKLGYNRCPEGHFKCMTEINIEDISAIVKKSWKYPNQ
jgi:heptosyltransferase-2